MLAVATGLHNGLDIWLPRTERRTRRRFSRAPSYSLAAVAEFRTSPGRHFPARLVVPSYAGRPFGHGMRIMGKRSGRPSTETTEFMAADKIAAVESHVDETVRHLARLIGRQMAREAFESRRAKPSRRIKPIASRSTLSSRD